MSALKTKLKLKVVPGASQSSIAGWLGDALKIRVVAAPEKGKANKEVLGLLSEVLSVPMVKLSILRGLSSPHKNVEVTGLSLDEIKLRISKVC
jgi:uncharacterized protein